MTALSLGPATQDILLARGTTPRLRLRLTSRDVRSGALRLRPGDDDRVEWTLAWPSGSVTSTTDAGAGLRLDPVSRVVTHPFAFADLAQVPSAGVPYRVELVNADGARRRWIEGVIRIGGQA